MPADYLPVPHLEQIATPHAVVVVGLDAEHVLVSDPAFRDAPQSIPRADFLLAWAEFDYRYATIVRA
jgi:predicted double-glycine peptidase